MRRQSSSSQRSPAASGVSADMSSSGVSPPSSSSVSFSSSVASSSSVSSSSFSSSSVSSPSFSPSSFSSSSFSSSSFSSSSFSSSSFSTSASSSSASSSSVLGASTFASAFSASVSSSPSSLPHRNGRKVEGKSSAAPVKQSCSTCCRAPFLYSCDLDALLSVNIGGLLTVPRVPSAVCDRQSVSSARREAPREKQASERRSEAENATERSACAAEDADAQGDAAGVPGVAVHDREDRGTEQGENDAEGRAVFWGRGGDDQGQRGPPLFPDHELASPDFVEGVKEASLNAKKLSSLYGEEDETDRFVVCVSLFSHGQRVFHPVTCHPSPCPAFASCSSEKGEDAPLSPPSSSLPSIKRYLRPCLHALIGGSCRRSSSFSSSVSPELSRSLDASPSFLPFHVSLRLPIRVSALPRDAFLLCAVRKKEVLPETADDCPSSLYAVGILPLFDSGGHMRQGRELLKLVRVLSPPSLSSLSPFSPSSESPTPRFFERDEAAREELLRLFESAVLSPALLPSSRFLSQKKERIAFQEGAGDATDRAGRASRHPREPFEAFSAKERRICRPLQEQERRARSAELAAAAVAGRSGDTAPHTRLPKMSAETVMSLLLSPSAPWLAALLSEAPAETVRSGKGTVRPCVWGGGSASLSAAASPQRDEFRRRKKESGFSCRAELQANRREVVAPFVPVEEQPSSSSDEDRYPRNAFTFSRFSSPSSLLPLATHPIGDLQAGDSSHTLPLRSEPSHPSLSVFAERRLSSSPKRDATSRARPESPSSAGAAFDATAEEIQGESTCRATIFGDLQPSEKPRKEPSCAGQEAMGGGNGGRDEEQWVWQCGRARRALREMYHRHIVLERELFRCAKSLDMLERGAFASGGMRVDSVAQENLQRSLFEILSLLQNHGDFLEAQRRASLACRLWERSNLPTPHATKRRPCRTTANSQDESEFQPFPQASFASSSSSASSTSSSLSSASSSSLFSSRSIRRPLSSSSSSGSPPIDADCLPSQVEPLASETWEESVSASRSSPRARSDGVFEPLRLHAETTAMAAVGAAGYLYLELPFYSLPALHGEPRIVSHASHLPVAPAAVLQQQLHAQVSQQMQKQSSSSSLSGERTKSGGLAGSAGLFGISREEQGDNGGVVGGGVSRGDACACMQHPLAPAVLARALQQQFQRHSVSPPNGDHSASTSAPSSSSSSCAPSLGSSASSPSLRPLGGSGSRTDRRPEAERAEGRGLEREKELGSGNEGEKGEKQDATKRDRSVNEVLRPAASHEAPTAVSQLSFKSGNETGETARRSAAGSSTDFRPQEGPSQANWMSTCWGVSSALTPFSLASSLPQLSSPPPGPARAVLPSPAVGSSSSVGERRNSLLDNRGAESAAALDDSSRSFPAEMPETETEQSLLGLSVGEALLALQARNRGGREEEATTNGEMRREERTHQTVEGEKENRRQFLLDFSSYVPHPAGLLSQPTALDLLGHASAAGGALRPEGSAVALLRGLLQSPPHPLRLHERQLLWTYR
ncbi:phosphatidylinositol 3- and 4-kinase [Toxoplasma gondii RUB]|uniref:Phosphatidylinositol 3-and 4-kinase n=1 Tax=Toxoplasma gondii RUB TaxID=935652 RepID=A0A086LZP6_TOXGO|nr:phosphatidylinositol 3- and 4-kinase [Toxoplasma gondii RUB]